MKSAKQEIIEELDALQEQFWPRPVRTQDQHERFLRDYLRDLDGYPSETVRLACANWRKSDATKFPTPGQLLKLVRALVPERRGQTVGPWAPLSDADYAALSLSEKIRHHRILATEQRRLAGPMWRNGRPAGPDELGEKWRDNSERARWHSEEADRLKALFSRSEQSA